MIHRLSRIGFPSFRRPRSSSRRRATRPLQQLRATEPLEARMMLAADVLPAWQNPVNPADVDGNGAVVSMDALVILNALSRGGDELLAHSGVGATQSAVLATDSPFLDVDGDQQVTTDDALRVLDTVAPEAEAEETTVPIQIGDGVFVIYNPGSGNLRVDSDLAIQTLEIKSASGMFTGSPAMNLGGMFDVDTDFKIFKLFEEGFQDLNFGNVAQTGLTEEFVRRDLTISGSHSRPPEWSTNPEQWPDGRDLGLNNHQAQFRLEVTDLNSNPITSLAVGQEFYVRAFVEDVRATSLIGDTLNGTLNAGVYAAYLDVQFDANLAAAVGNVQYAAGYTASQSGTLSAGLLDEIGAQSSSLSPLGRDERELFRVQMTALAGGDLQFVGDLADISPQHDTLLFDMSSPVDDLEIKFLDSPTITVSDTPTDVDLVAFAKAIADTGAEFYGAFWCSACHAQQDLFEDGKDFLPYIESSNPDGSQTQEAIDAGITSYPTWILADGTRLVGSQSLETLSQQTGVPIPQSNLPFVKPIDDQTLLSGSPLLIPLDGYDPNGGELTYTVTSDNPTLVSTFQPQRNFSMRIDVQTYGEMVFQLLDGLAPRPTQRIIELAEDGFYDGLTFHRILNDFVIQGGDPEGDGTGGSDLPDFDDQFNLDLQHNRTGLLSFAKSGDDTNNSQFFITEGPSRHLDFNHSIFGQLIEGEYIRDVISNLPASGQGIPSSPVTMESVDIFQDLENGLVMLSAPEGTAGTANITVTVRDQDGHEYTETFQVTVAPDDQNGGPYLDDIPTITTAADTPVTFQLSANDVEGDPVTYSGLDGSNITLSVDPTTGLVTATPAAGFIGTAVATVRVQATDGSDTYDTYDSQRVTFLVLPNAPVVDLASTSDSGISDTDNLTNETNLQFSISGVTDGAFVQIFADGSQIGEGTADGTEITITTANLSALGDGTYEITAKQTVDDETSEASDVLEVTLDQTSPGAFTSTPPSEAMTGDEVLYNANHPEEGQSGFQYSLSNAPDSAVIDPTTGQFAWTPTSEDVGLQTFAIVGTDAAGNTAQQTVNLDVLQRELMRFRLQTADLNGNAIAAVAAGQAFQLQVYVEDIRDEALGVYAAYVDVLYDTNALQTDGPIVFGSSFPHVQQGSVTTAGLIDEAGGTADTEPLGAGEFLLFSIQLVGQTAGDVQFTANPADDLPVHDTLLRGLGQPLLSNQMIYQGTTLEIVSATSAQDDDFQVLEDSDPSRIFVLANDIAIPETAVLSITQVSTPSHGTAQIVNTDQGPAIEYQPPTDYVGQDTFTYTIEDDAGNSSTATVTVTVVNVNDLPSALDDEFTLSEDAGATALNVLNNDNSAPDTGETLTIEDVSLPTHGVVAITEGGTLLRYTPDLNFSGTDTFTYTISDGNGGTATATVTVTVTEVNDPPVPVDDEQSTNEDEALVINVADLLANDAVGGGETGQTLTILSVEAVGPGTVVLDGTTITYTPPANYFGTTTFEYTVQDDGNTNGLSDPQSAVGTVTVTVNAVNDLPTANDDTAVAQTGGSAILIDVLNNDSIAPDEAETLTVTAVGAATHGTTRLTEDGDVEYTPSATFSGTDSFTYTISDGNGGESTATVTVTVQNFVPGGLTGQVFYDYNNDGIRQAGELQLAGSRIELVGTDMQGQRVEMYSTSLADGTFRFDELTPGNYRVTQQQPTFTVDGRDMTTAEGVQVAAKNSFSVALSADGLGNGALYFAEQRLDPKFTLWDALSSSTPTGFYASVDAEEGREWTRQDAGWNGVEIADIIFSEDLSTLTISIIDDGQLQAATVPRSDHARVQVIGREGASHLIRFKGPQSAFNFRPVAEGESVRDELFADGSW